MVVSFLSWKMGSEEVPTCWFFRRQSMHRIGLCQPCDAKCSWAFAEKRNVHPQSRQWRFLLLNLSEHVIWQFEQLFGGCNFRSLNCFCWLGESTKTFKQILHFLSITIAWGRTCKEESKVTITWLRLEYLPKGTNTWLNHVIRRQLVWLTKWEF